MAVIDPSAVWDFAGEIVGRIVPSRATTTATVTRIDADGTVWVTTGDGGEAPAASAAAGVSVGDTVTLEWDGSAMGIRSNVSNPAPAGSVVRLAVDRAQGVASAAQRVADAVNQHFFADGNGIHVTEATQDEWNANHTGANVLINSIGQLFRDGLNNLLTLTTENGARALTVWDGLGNAAGNIRAIIGETIQLGSTASGNYMTLDSDGVKIYNENKTDGPSARIGHDFASFLGGVLDFGSSYVGTSSNKIWESIISHNPPNHSHVGTGGGQIRFTTTHTGESTEKTVATFIVDEFKIDRNCTLTGNVESAFATSELTILDGNASIPADGSIGPYEQAPTKSGYTALGIVGWSSNSAGVHLSRCRLNNGFVEWIAKNVDSVARKPTVKVTILWARDA